MKVPGAVLVVLAILIAAVPLVTDCHSQGRMLTLENGRQVDMKCHWAGRAAAAVALPLAGLGVALALNRRRTGLREMGAVGVLLGAATILAPTALIGVCASADMLCNSLMRPTLILAGTLVIATSLLPIFAGYRAAQPALAA